VFAHRLGSLGVLLRVRILNDSPGDEGDFVVYCVKLHGCIRIIGHTIIGVGCRWRRESLVVQKTASIAFAAKQPLELGLDVLAL
jgi:hypothetical protein